MFTNERVKVGSTKGCGENKVAMKLADVITVLLFSFYDFGIKGWRDFIGFDEGFDLLFNFKDFKGMVNS